LPKDQLVENDVLIALDGHVVYKMPLAAVMKLLTDGTRDRICTLDFHRRDPDCDTNIERALAQGALKRFLHFLHRPAESQVLIADMFKQICAKITCLNLRFSRHFQAKITC
jgi:hypothetical protein